MTSPIIELIEAIFTGICNLQYTVDLNFRVAAALKNRAQVITMLSVVCVDVCVCVCRRVCVCIRARACVSAELCVRLERHNRHSFLLPAK